MFISKRYMFVSEREYYTYYTCFIVKSLTLSIPTVYLFENINSEDTAPVY